MPWYLSLKWPGVLFVVGLSILALPEPINASAGIPIMVAFVWAIVTGRSRRIFWDAQTRARAYRDVRRRER